MHILIVSHACVTPVNQEFFAEVERQTGWDVTIVAPATWKTEYGRKELRRWEGFEGNLIGLPVLGSGNIPLHVYRSFLLSLLYDVDPDVIYMHHEPYGAATAQVYAANALAQRVPIGFFTWQNINKRYPTPFRQLEQWVFNQSTFAVSGSDSASAVLREKGYPGPVSIIPAGIDPTLYTSSVRRDALPDLPDDAIQIGFVGRIIEEKGLHTMLQALARVEGIPWHWTLVGTGAYTDPLTELAERLGVADRLTFTGYVDHTEVPTYLAGFDLVVMPSETQPNWKEQFGRVIIEAMACGTPVLGSDSGEIPHLIKRTGGGLVFREGNIDHCMTQATRLLADADLREQLAAEGKTYVVQHYTNAALTEKFVDTIRSSV